jgi:glutathione S-transferase
MPDLILYHTLFSTCSQKVRFALAKKGLSFESRIVDLSKGEHLEDWYLAINPNGVVPSLVHAGSAITDSSVICEYLDEVFPDPPLSPRDPVCKAAMRAWMRYFEKAGFEARIADSCREVLRFSKTANTERTCS